MVEALGRLCRWGRRPLAAAALSAVWPGLGHFGYCNYRAMALSFGTLGGAAVVSTWLATRSERTLLAWSVTPSFLWSVIIGAVGALIFRVAVVADAYRVARRRCRPQHRDTRRLVSVAVWVVLAGIITAPHLVVVHYATAQIALLSNVFTATDTRTAIPTPLQVTSVTKVTVPAAGTNETPEAHVSVPPETISVSATTRSTQATVAPAATPPTTANPPTSTVPPTTANPSTTAVPPTSTVPPTTAAPPTSANPSTGSGSTAAHQQSWDGAERLTIALLGSDAGFDRYGVRTDTIIVFSIDLATGQAAAFNIPRNWSGLTFPEGTPAAGQWPDGYPGLANEVYGLGSRFPQAFPDVEDPAGHSIRLALAQLTGLQIHYYVLVGMEGFVETIDLFGGIDVHVTEWINDRIKPIVAGGPHIDIVVQPGDYHLDGLTSLGYVRSRSSSSDYHRMTRQRCLVEALIDQTSPAEVLSNYMALTNIIADHFTTDIPLGHLDDLVILGRDLDTTTIITVNFVPPEFPTGRAPVTQVRQAVAQAFEGTTNDANVSLADRCRGSG